MQVNQYTIDSEQKAAQKFDHGTIRLLSNTRKENRMGNPVSYQIIPYAGGTPGGDRRQIRPGRVDISSPELYG